MIEIRRDRAMPEGNRALSGKSIELRDAIGQMQVGDSFDWESRSLPYTIAKELGVKITTRDLGTGKFAVWRRK